eukprot:19372-Eustigmatos_ZCMA.PRE.1
MVLLGPHVRRWQAAGAEDRAVVHRHQVLVTVGHIYGRPRRRIRAQGELVTCALTNWTFNASSGARDQTNSYR